MSTETKCPHCGAEYSGGYGYICGTVGMQTSEACDHAATLRQQLADEKAKKVKDKIINKQTNMKNKFWIKVINLQEEESDYTVEIENRTTPPEYIYLGIHVYKQMGPLLINGRFVYKQLPVLLATEVEDNSNTQSPS